MSTTWFMRLLSPGMINRRHAATGILAVLFLSLAAIIAAPGLMPGEYYWVSHSVSESAAQGLEGAWLARLGLVLFGLAVLWLAGAAARVWARAAVWMHIGFGVMMVATAVFSHQPFLAGVPFDPVEDLLHSITATVMGFAFSIGVFVRFLQRRQGDVSGRVLDLVGLVSAIVIPLLMVIRPGIGGLVQRLMFLVGYVWYGYEAWGLSKVPEAAHSG